MAVAIAFGTLAVVGTKATSNSPDLNGDGKVDVFDHSTLLANWGKSGTIADINGDGTVSVFDLSVLLAQWGTAPTPAPTPTPTPPGATASGVPLPGAISGYTQVCGEEFAKAAATGSWGTTSASTIVYSSGCNWTEYPDGWPSTYTGGAPGYAPAKVLSVHDGQLDFYLTDINGKAQGANPSPLLANGTKYQTYGKYIMRAKFPVISGYHNAWLLWPQSDSDWQYAESDFPEFNLSSSTVKAYAHYGGSGAQDSYSKTIDTTQWHTYEQSWDPLGRSYYVDGVLIGRSTNAIFNKPSACNSRPSLARPHRAAPATLWSTG